MTGLGPRRQADLRRILRSAVSGRPRLVRACAAALFLLMVTISALWTAVARPVKLDNAPSKAQSAADSLIAKIESLSKPSPGFRGPLQPVTISDAEANSYLKVKGRGFLPPAVHDPVIHIQRDQITGTADVDFNELERLANQDDDWGTQLVAMVFRGKQRVEAAGKLETGNGQGKFTLTSLTVGTTSIPAGFVNFMVQSYMEKKYKIDLSKPFPLPPTVDHIELADGQAMLHRIGFSRR